MRQNLTLYRAFSGLIQKASNARGPSDVENQVILANNVGRDGAEGSETVFLMAADEGGEYELVYFKTLDDEFNKVLKFYKAKIREVMAEAARLNKQMEALIAPLRVKVKDPKGLATNLEEMEKLTSDVDVPPLHLQQDTATLYSCLNKQSIIDDGRWTFPFPEMKTRDDIYPKGLQCFPEELLLEIFVRLPAKSIFRFKCVSRNWHSLLSDGSFFRDFVSRSNDSPPFALIFQFAKHIGIPCLGSGNNSLINQCSQFPFDQIPGAEIAATSNDLILYRSNRQESAYSVANPFTRQRVTLPTHSGEKCCTSTGLVSIVGNGITSYDVVRVLKDPDNAQHCLNLETFSSRTGEWRSFEVKNCRFKVETDSRPSIVFNGTLHWICNRMTALLAYDPHCMNPGGCRLIDVPSQAYYMNGKNAILGVSGERMYYFEMSGISIHDRKLPGWKLWRMKDYKRGEWSLDRKGDDREVESMGAVWIMLSRHSPLFPVAFHPWNEGIVYFRCEDYVLRFDAKKGWFEDDFFGLSCGRMVSTVKIFPFLIPFCPSQLPHGKLTNGNDAKVKLW